jgi:glycosyltransferase involved in cell wall biosynthesis
MGAPMQVCFLCDDVTRRTGTGTYAVELVPRLQALGIRCKVFCSAGRPAPKLGDVEPRAVLTSWSNGYRKPLRTRRDARAVSHEIADADLVHALVEPYAPLAERLRTPTRPTVITAHGTYAVAPFDQWFQRRLYRRAFRRAARVACVSRYTARAVEHVVPARTAVVDSGVSIGRFRQTDTARDPAPLVLCVGALKSRKGQDVLVRAFADVRRAVPAARLALVGAVHNVAYAAKLHALVETLGLSGAVTFEGDVPDDDLVGWYKRAWAFALTPVNVGRHFEGFGLVYLEAGACGVPSVATRDNGAEEAVLDGETGLLVPQHDAAATAQALARLLTDHALRARLGDAARRRAEALTWNKTAAQYTALYDEVLRR